MIKVAAFGEVMMRLQTPDLQLLKQANHLEMSFSGTGVNVVSALTNFGHHGFLVSKLPLNAVGEAAKSSIQKLGIQTQYVVRGGDYLGIYFLEKGFGVRPSRVTYTNRLDSSFNKGRMEDYDFENIVNEVDVLHFCGITLAMNEQVREQVILLATAMKNAGGKVIFDCNYRASLWGENGYKKAKRYYEKMLSLADLVMMNERDAISILGMETNHSERKEQLCELIPKVAALYDIELIAGTHREIHGDNNHSLTGFMYLEQSMSFSKTLTFAVHDRIGSGDAFTSGIIHGYYKGFSPDKTVAFATTAGMIAHSIVGDTPMSSEYDIFQIMSESVGDVER
ncbi:sugar kinase [Alkalihalobacillus sp. 1P02AB]|uniref:sugar kinase n=1 Tax=Alkalihalobacillus sp. 1P02AB TaxID=3132260 RepID=UPI0039A5A571